MIPITSGFGFNVFISPDKQEELLRKIMFLLKGIDWTTEGFFFNFENYKAGEFHAKIWIRANKNLQQEIKKLLLHFPQRENIDIHLENYFIEYSGENISDFTETNEGWIELKEKGTKYALQLKESLNVMPLTLTNNKLQEIAEQIVKDKPEMIQKFIEFHFIMNPLIHFEKGYQTEEQVRMRCIQEALKKTLTPLQEKNIDETLNQFGGVLDKLAKV